MFGTKPKYKHLILNDNFHCQKEDNISFSNYKNIYKCGENKYLTKTEGRANSEKRFKKEIYQCYNCNEKSRIYYLNHPSKIQHDLLKIFIGSTISLLKETISKEDENNYFLFLRIFNMNKEVFKKIINIKFYQFGIEWKENAKIYIKDENYDDGLSTITQGYIISPYVKNIHNYFGDFKEWKTKFSNKIITIEKKPWTILNYALAFNNFKVIELLLIFGADNSVGDNYFYDSLQLSKFLKCDVKFEELLNKYDVRYKFPKFHLYFNLKFNYFIL
jgi:hypothetical protein